MFEMRRIECTSVGGSAWTCSVHTLLHDIELLTNWQPGDPVPDSIMTVSDPLAADAIDETGVLQDDSARKDANRVFYRIVDPRVLEMIALTRRIFCTF